jgi:hypothetical protein
LYAQEGTVPTIAKLLVKLKDSINFKGGSSSLRKIVRDLGFRWKQTMTNRGVLIERHNIRSLRVSYLAAIRRYRADGSPIIFQDETYIHSSHTRPKTWDGDNYSGLLAPTSKGERLIIVHAGRRAGFISNALLIYKSRQKTGDYHNEMDSKNYARWLKTMLIRNLPPKSILVIDNASYHNIQADITSAPESPGIIRCATRVDLPTPQHAPH